MASCLGGEALIGREDLVTDERMLAGTPLRKLRAA